MKINDNMNYCILSNCIDESLLNRFQGYPIIDGDLSYDELVAKLEFFTSKVLVFKESLYNLTAEERKKILDLLKKQHVYYVNITSDIEQALGADYIIVFDNDKLIMEGPKEDILKEEKALKRLGFGLPFVVDLSTQLKIYGVIKKEYFDMNSLVGDLWN